MSGIGLSPPLQVLGTGLAIAPILLVILTGGLVGMSIRNMFDSILSDDEAAQGAETGDAGAPAPSGGDEGMADGGLMAEEGGDDFGGFGGLEEGGGDDFGDDEFGDMDDAGAGNDELEHRLDELENEVGSLSSTVNTVRTENEQISETVEDVEENVRKLLDIYEMVTRGVNPFADDIEAGMGGGMDDGSFGLFDDGADGGGGGDEGLDDDIASADAEGFFDEDLVDDGGDEEFDVDDDGFEDGDDVFEDAEGDFADDGGGGGDGGGFEDEFDEEFGDDASPDAGGDTSGGEGGKSFQELKDEYDSGDAEWADGEAPEDAAVEPDADEPDDGDVSASASADASESADHGDALADDELFDEVIEDGEASAAEPDPEPEPEPTDDQAVIDPEPASEPGAGLAPDPEPEPTDDEAAESANADRTTESTTTDTAAESTTTGTAAESGNTDRTAASATTGATGQSDAATGKPYLAELPGGFAGDLVVVEWLEFLTSQSGYRATDDAIDYYERIDWISPAVAEELREYLRGFDAIEGDGGELTIDDHTQSLQYISQLDGDGGAGVALSKLVGGGGNGLQR